MDFSSTKKELWARTEIRIGCIPTCLFSASPRARASWRRQQQASEQPPNGQIDIVRLQHLHCNIWIPGLLLVGSVSRDKSALPGLLQLPSPCKTIGSQSSSNTPANSAGLAYSALWVTGSLLSSHGRRKALSALYSWITAHGPTDLQ